MRTSLIPVRVSAVSPYDADITKELLDRCLNGGLVLGGDMTWFATQAELDLPHITFRLSPRN